MTPEQEQRIEELVDGISAAVGEFNLGPMDLKSLAHAFGEVQRLTCEARKVLGLPRMDGLEPQA